MSVRLSASGQYLARTANLPTSGAFTICGWGCRRADNSTYSNICSLDNQLASAANELNFGTDVDGDTAIVYTSAGGIASLGVVLTLDVPFFWFMRGSSTGAAGITAGVRFHYQNAFTTVTNTGQSFTTGALLIGNNTFDEFFNGDIWNVMVWDRAVTLSDLLRQSYFARVLDKSSLNFHWRLKRPDALFDFGPNTRHPTLSGTLKASSQKLFRDEFPRRRGAASVAAAYTMTAAQGSYALTGQSATLTYSGAAKTLTAAQGSYALTGQSISMVHGRTMVCAKGDYTLTGSTAFADYQMAAALGSYTLNGQAATLIHGRLMPCAQGAYALTGQSISMIHGRIMTCATGSYALTGQSATLTYTPLVGSYSLSANQGSYTLTGQTVRLAVGRALLCGQASYALNGQAVTLVRGAARMVCSPGAYALTGSDVTLNYSGAPLGGGFFPVRARRVPIR